MKNKNSLNPSLALEYLSRCGFKKDHRRDVFVKLIVDDLYFSLLFDEEGILTEHGVSLGIYSQRASEKMLNTLKFKYPSVESDAFTHMVVENFLYIGAEYTSDSSLLLNGFLRTFDELVCPFIENFKTSNDVLKLMNKNKMIGGTAHEIYQISYEYYYGSEENFSRLFSKIKEKPSSNMVANFVSYWNFEK